jgi:hypothetical protein
MSWLEGDILFLATSVQKLFLAGGRQTSACEEEDDVRRRNPHIIVVEISTLGSLELTYFERQWYNATF